MTPHGNIHSELISYLGQNILSKIDERGNLTVSCGLVFSEMLVSETALALGWLVDCLVAWLLAWLLGSCRDRRCVLTIYVGDE